MALAVPKELAPWIRELELGPDDGQKATVFVPAAYLFFRGHFEGIPMVPGVAQLTEIVAPLARRRHAELGQVREARRLRFRRPISPNETVTVVLDPPELETAPRAETELGERRRVRFELSVGEEIVANGALVFDASSSDAER